jgi:hypothetical protein
LLLVIVVMLVVFKSQFPTGAADLVHRCPCGVYGSFYSVLCPLATAAG